MQNWNKPSKTLSITNISGEFVDDEVIIGAESNARYVLVTYDPLRDSTKNETYDNMYIDNQANNIIDFTEINPFGKI